MKTESSQVQCCIVGGGPAGVMLGYLLARAGVSVTILEKHKDFFRDFRGDTVHPSTLELLYELGLIDEFLKVPHQKVTSVGITIGDFSAELANFRQLRTHCPFTVLMPQWDFLNFLSEQGKKYSNFDLRMEHEATDLVRDRDRVRGVVVRTPDGIETVRADLVVACDGRHSVMRAAGQLPVRELGVPIDVLWFRISRQPDDRTQVLGNVNYGKLLVLINRNEYFQAAMVVRKGSFEEVKQNGLERFRQDVAQVAPFLSDRVAELQSWDQVKLLSVQINRLKQWHRPGLLCIGDAAHAMSPVFGIGINLAIQDAAAAANTLAQPLRDRQNTDDLLSEVQRRREFRTRLIQGLQTIAHSGMQHAFRSKGPIHPPPLLRFIAKSRVLEPVLLRVVGVGIYPEHIKTVTMPRRPKPTKIAQMAGFVAGIAAGATVAWLGITGRR
jgi:2-polyprenyl-6-methoxyphenol hydroxylase-like FAD-dependent oxidoreductase